MKKIEKNLLKHLLSIYLLWTLKMCYCSLFYCFSCYQIVGIRWQMSKDKFKHYKVSQKIQFNPKEFSQIFSRFFRLSCHLWTQFSQLLKSQFGKFLCLSHREFPEVFKTPPTFISSTFQSGVIAKMPLKSVFFGTPCMYLKYCMKNSHFKLCYLKWKWVESDRHFACYWYIWNTVQNRMVILLNYEIWNEKEWTGTDH